MREVVYRAKGMITKDYAKALEAGIIRTYLVPVEPEKPELSEKRKAILRKI